MSECHPTSSVSDEVAGRGPARARAAPLPPSPPTRSLSPGCCGERWNRLVMATSGDGDRRDDRSSNLCACKVSPTPTPQTQATYRRGAPYNIISNLS
ncbi:hypothetical protein Q4I30_000623 [Leishmania utingensis]|uniref:Uncharacterized protein n=1 Tax=Leishmania utingensis TaxID=653362 RepID=A0AAW3B1V4_9TRYP